MNRIDRKFKELKQHNKKALILFITAGDPSLKVTAQTLRFCEQAGVDCVELGIPFSDPLADGPVIQESSYRAVRRHVRLDQILSMVRAERKRGLNLPLVVMSSVNPLHAMEFETCAKRMQRSGIDGLIIPDLPFDEDAWILRTFSRHKIHPILMTTPTTDRARHQKILSHSRGFVYYVSLIGLTGTLQCDHVSIKASVSRSQKMTSTPVCVGFGISTPQHAKRVVRYADGVVVGSAVVQHLYRYSKQGLSDKSKRFIESFVKAVKRKVI